MKASRNRIGRVAWLVACCAASWACGEGASGEGGGDGGDVAGGGSSSGSGATASGDDEDELPVGRRPEDCVAPPNASAVYDAEPRDPVCTLTCEAGWADCDGSRDNGCETSTSDPAACGRCVDACLSDLCGEGFACAGYQADVWSLQLSSAAFDALAVAPSGDVIVGLDSGQLESEQQPLPAVAPGRVASFSSAGLSWQTERGRIGESPIAASDAWLTATSAGAFYLQSFATASVGGETFPAEGEGDIMLSHFSFDGELVWTRTLGFNRSVHALEADEHSNLLAVVTPPSGPVEFAGRVADDFLDPGFLKFVFNAQGDPLWFDDRLSPLSAGPIADGVVYDTSRRPRSALTGEELDPPRGVNLRSAAAVVRSTDGGLIVAGRGEVQEVSFRGGHPAPSEVAPNRGTFSAVNKLFVAKYSATGDRLWETSFGFAQTNWLLGLREAPDGNVYAFALAGLATERLRAPMPVYVARIASDGQQRGAFVYATRGDDVRHEFNLGEDGVVHFASVFQDQAVLDQELSGDGLVAGSIRFDP